MRIGVSYRTTDMLHENNIDSEPIIIDSVTARVYEELINHADFKTQIEDLVKQHMVTIRNTHFGERFNIVDLDINLLGTTMINQEPIAFKGARK